MSDEELIAWVRNGFGNVVADRIEALVNERDAALAANRGLVRLNEATEARAERFRSALEEIAEYDTGATAGLAYNARATLKGDDHE